MAQALAFPPGMVEPLRIAPEVALTTAEGGEFRLSQHRGEAVVLVFGYTRCSDVCPMTLGRLVQVRTRFASGEKAAETTGAGWLRTVRVNWKVRALDSAWTASMVGALRAA